MPIEVQEHHTCCANFFGGPTAILGYHHKQIVALFGQDMSMPKIALFKSIRPPSPGLPGYVDWPTASGRMANSLTPSYDFC